jgi:hypothetical protein
MRRLVCSACVPPRIPAALLAHPPDAHTVRRELASTPADPAELIGLLGLLSIVLNASTD